MGEIRKLAAILVSDVVGYSRLAGADEDRILARLRTLRSDLIDPIISVHHGRIVKRTGDGSVIEFRSVVDAVRCALEVQTGMVERNVGLPPDKRIEFRIGVHLGDVVEESDGDLMGDGVNVAARLEGICEPGGICLSEDAYRQVKSRLDLQVADLGPQSLKNIAEPVHAYLLRHGPPATQKSPQAPTKTRGILARWPSLAAALVLSLLAVGAFVWRAGYAPRFIAASADDKLANAPRLSIVVLPFENLSGDKEQDYFADGITDDLTTDLSHLADSFVIARGTASTYKGKPVDAKQIGRELGVRYVLEGSVRRLGETITVNAQLVSTETGAHVWADHTGAKIGLAESLIDRFMWLGGGDEAVDIPRAEALVASALSAEPNNASAHFAKASLLGAKKQFSDQFAEIDAAIENDRNFALAYASRGDMLTWAGRAAESIAEDETALRLSPRDPGRNIWQFGICHAYTHLAQWEKAIEWCQKSIATDAGTWFPYVDLAAANAWLGHEAEAKSAIAGLLKVYPGFTVQSYADIAARVTYNPTFAQQIQRIVEGLRKAGLPEGEKKTN